VGRVVLFVLCLYPYVYLLARAALGERAVRMMEAARLLGADAPPRAGGGAAAWRGRPSPPAPRWR
jgi:hypothetical protein